MHKNTVNPQNQQGKKQDLIVTLRINLSLKDAYSGTFWEDTVDLLLPKEKA